MLQHKLVAKYQVELSRLRHVNKNLIEQVDKLHRSRLSILEELVYQRLLNTCLRFELEDYHSPSPKKINPNVSRKLDFRSNSNSSGISSIESDEVTNTTRSSSSSENTKKKKKGLLQNIKIWGRSKNISSANTSESGFIPSKAGKIRRFSTSSIPPDISSLRNREESELLFPWQKKEAVDSNSPELPMIRRVRRVSFNDSINSVRYIYDDSPESDKNISENDRKKAENSNDSSDMKTSPGTGPLLERNNAEMPSPTFNVQRREKVSTGLGNQDKIETQVVSRKETVQVECLSSAMPNAASGASKFGDVVNAIAAFIIVFFLVLVYFRFFFTFKPKGSLIVLTLNKLFRLRS